MRQRQEEKEEKEEEEIPSPSLGGEGDDGLPDGKERGERERLCTVIITLQQGQCTQKQANKYSPM